jgi:hypothetical protein
MVAGGAAQSRTHLDGTAVGRESGTVASGRDQG